ncbi:MAG: RNA polymerase sigma factor, partial [Myxococcales bacterium]|nr:RNA polymerase sigma factor [Myxococcales bacterium]
VHPARRGPEGAGGMSLAEPIEVDPERVTAARAGQEGAFGALVRPLLPRLEAFALRMLAHPDDAAEAVQDALLKAHQGLAGFRGEARFETWLLSILTRVCIDALRARQRWRWDAQAHARTDPQAPHHAVLEQLRAPDAGFEAREHIAFCLCCVSRSLPPEEAAAVLLREVFGLRNKEAARACGVSESVLRHRLSAGRTAMKDAFEGLCGLVSKAGVCYQCEGLRDRTPAERQGEALPDLSGDREASLRRRLAIVRDADLEHGRAAALHRLMFRAVADTEARARRPRSTPD